FRPHALVRSELHLRIAVWSDEAVVAGGYWTVDPRRLATERDPLCVFGTAVGLPNQRDESQCAGQHQQAEYERCDACDWWDRERCSVVRHHRIFGASSGDLWYGGAEYFGWPGSGESGSVSVPEVPPDRADWRGVPIRVFQFHQHTAFQPPGYDI